MQHFLGTAPHVRYKGLFSLWRWMLGPGRFRGLEEHLNHLVHAMVARVMKWGVVLVGRAIGHGRADDIATP